MLDELMGGGTYEEVKKQKGVNISDRQLNTLPLGCA